MFKHRGYLGWIRDVATSPRPYDAWPSIIIDDALMDDYRQTFNYMREIGLNEMSVWGLFVAHAWPVDVERAMDAERDEQVRAVLAEAKRHGIRVLTGLGVYSWGFEAIIRAHPHLSRGNEQALCASISENWEWQRRVLDYVMSFPLDGVSLQSADQGRCPCDECARWGDIEYHARLNDRVASYIKHHWPERIVGINNWGMSFHNPADLPHLLLMTRHADYVIDTHDSARTHDPAYRRALIAALPCAFGTVGAPNVEPPQHWERDRWFLPTLKHTAQNIQELYADGGRAVENFMHLAANPGDDVSMRLAAAVERDPSGDWRAMLAGILEALYAPVDTNALNGVVDLFIHAENAYFDRAEHRGPSDAVRLEPLISDHAGPPTYLTDHIAAEDLPAYEDDLQTLIARARTLVEGVGDQNRMRLVVRCIERMIDDVVAARARGTP